MAEAAKERVKKPEPRTLENYVKPKLGELLGGKLGTVLYEGLSIVESGAKAGRSALEARLNERIDNVSIEASSASGAAATAGTAASKAAQSAEMAEQKANAASTSAAEAEAQAVSMAEDVAKVTRDASSAKSAAAEAKAAAETASGDAAEIKEALTVTLKATNGGDEKETLRGRKTIEFVLMKLGKLSTSVAGFVDRLAESDRKHAELEGKVAKLREETEGMFEAYLQVLVQAELVEATPEAPEGEPQADTQEGEQ